MRLGFIGLGKMGMNMITRLVGGGHQIVAQDTALEKQRQVEGIGATFAPTLPALAGALPAPRAIWLMLPAGAVTESVIGLLTPLLSPGDVLVDGGNADFHDSKRRAEALARAGVHYLDCGTSGGVWGLEQGYSLMVGGPPEAFERVEPAFRTLAPPNGYLHVGPSGAGHFAKMVHNAIEYGMMEAYGEGFALLDAAARTHGYDYDLPRLGHLWGQGAVIRSWLLELLVRALSEDPHLHHVAGYVEDSGMGRQAAREAIDAAVATPVLTLSLQARFLSRQPDGFAAKVAAALRNQFGGHAIRTEPAAPHPSDKKVPQ